MLPTLVAIHASKPRKHRWYQSPKTIRHGVMAFFFLFLLHVAWDHQVKGGGPRGTPSVEAYCPFGGIETLYQFLTTGGFVRRIEPSALILLAALLLLTLVTSRGFCGWICPFGSLQEWLGLLGRKIFKKRFNPTGSWDRALRYFKYAVLVLVIGLTWHTGALVFRAFDPFLAFFHLGNGLSEMPWAYGILAAVLLGSLVIERFFCKYACPLGAVIGVLGRVGLSSIHRDPTDCKGCNVCQQKCPFHIDFLSTTTIRDAECNNCMDCVVDCPKPTVLSMRGASWRLAQPVYASILIGGLFVMIGVSQVAGKWVTKPAEVSFTNAAGKLDPENVRGWMTLAEIGSGYGIPLRDLYLACGLPDRVPATARLNTIARDYKVAFEPDKVRAIVGGYLRGEKPQAVVPSEFKSAVSDPEPAEPAVKGFMTLNEIAIKTGVPTEYLVQSLGLPSTIDARVPVREWMHGHGKSIQDLRDAVARYRK